MKSNSSKKSLTLTNDVSHKKDWLRIMLLLERFMTSAYSSITIETELVTHVSIPKITTVYSNGILSALSHDFFRGY